MFMMTDTTKEVAVNRSGDLFGPERHCAEAVAVAVLEALDRESQQAAAHATPFGGGFGRTFCEACGALSGGLIAIGHLHGRLDPGGDWDLPAELAAELRHRFVKEFGAVQCSVLRERFGQEAQMDECRKLVMGTTQLLLEILGKESSGESAMDCDRAACSCGS